MTDPDGATSWLATFQPNSQTPDGQVLLKAGTVVYVLVSRTPWEQSLCVYRKSADRYVLAGTKALQYDKGKRTAVIHLPTSPEVETYWFRFMHKTAKHDPNRPWLCSRESIVVHNGARIHHAVDLMGTGRNVVVPVTHLGYQTRLLVEGGENSDHGELDVRVHYDVNSNVPAQERVVVLTAYARSDPQGYVLAPKEIPL